MSAERAAGSAPSAARDSGAKVALQIQFDQELSAPVFCRVAMPVGDCRRIESSFVSTRFGEQSLRQFRAPQYYERVDPGEAARPALGRWRLIQLLAQRGEVGSQLHRSRSPFQGADNPQRKLDRAPDLLPIRLRRKEQIRAQEHLHPLGSAASTGKMLRKRSKQRFGGFGCV